MFSGFIVIFFVKIYYKIRIFTILRIGVAKCSSIIMIMIILFLIILLSSVSTQSETTTLLMFSFLRSSYIIIKLMFSKGITSIEKKMLTEIWVTGGMNSWPINMWCKTLEVHYLLRWLGRDKTRPTGRVIRLIGTFTKVILFIINID